MKPWILDLCSGFGGASEAFANHPHWRVVRIENNPQLAHIAHTRLLDINHWMDWLPALIDEMGCPPKVVWASPPCLEFSEAFNAPKPTARREGREFKPDFTILQSCISIIGIVKPKFFIIENVAGASLDFRPYLGEWSQRIGPFYLWGEFPHLHVGEEFEHTKTSNDVWNDNPLRSNYKAIVPLEISEAFLDASMRQTTLEDWI